MESTHSSSETPRNEETIIAHAVHYRDEKGTDSDYPEGGTQAWLVVSGSAAIMFCTFGYLTGFGYVLTFDEARCGRSM